MHLNGWFEAFGGSLARLRHSSACRRRDAKNGYRCVLSTQAEVRGLGSVGERLVSAGSTDVCVRVRGLPRKVRTGEVAGVMLGCERVSGWHSRR